MPRKTPTKTVKRTAPRRTTKPTPPALSKPQKPIFSAATWAAVFVLVFLIAATVYINQQQERAEAESPTVAAQEENFVFENKETLVSLKIETAEGETVLLARNEENVWALKLPTEAEADQGLAEAAASQVNALRIVNEIQADPFSLGLDAPAFVITVEFQGGATHRLEVGEKTPTGNGYYARLDNQKTFIAAAAGIDALINLISNPPYVNTPTSVPAATSTPLPTETPAPPPETESPPEEATETPQP